jgi:enoyl-CoA hydratase/carnithine racemase
MSANLDAGHVYHERHDHILKITIDNVAKKNSFIPRMMLELSDSLTLLDEDPELWAGVLCAAGDNFTSGLDMPKFFGPGATLNPREEGDRSVRAGKSMPETDHHRGAGDGFHDWNRDDARGRHCDRVRGLALLPDGG